MSAFLCLAGHEFPGNQRFKRSSRPLGIRKTAVTECRVPRDPLKRLIVSLRDTRSDFAAGPVAIGESLEKPASEAIPQHPI
jgi:hypothetical protein